MKARQVHGNMTLTNLLINEFILGREGNISDDNQIIVDNVKEYLGHWYSFIDLSRQKCKDMFISMKFRGKQITWSDLPQDWWYEWNQGPYNYPTDFGACCFFAPHLNLDPTNHNITVEEMYHGLEADAKNGETNAFDVVLDVEQWNYAYYEANAPGFKISLHHHADKPMIQFSSQLINSGTETLINLKPSVSYTTDAAISKFSPIKRGCYTDGEVNLTYLTYDYGYRYEMNNCLIDQGMQDIVWNCRCLPRFFSECGDCGYYYGDFLDYCTGKGLHCANTRMKSLGVGEISKENNITVPEALENPTLIGNISKPDGITCIPDCKVQENTNQMSYAPYPQLGNFFYQKTFCDVASHIWQVTCQEENRTFFMNMKQPNLCLTLGAFEDYFGKTSSCEDWPRNYFNDYTDPVDTLVNELYQYGRDNLALVHVVIQSPYVTMIKRDVEMTFTSYIANTGGIIGLCLGFSFITGFELIFWCCCCCRGLKKNLETMVQVNP
jgi:hypothetical protein